MSEITLMLITLGSVSLFIFFNHPLLAVLSIILQTLGIFWILLTTQPSSWLSYLIFLVMVGGLLVVFSYLSALIPNEIFLFEKKQWGYLFTIILFLSTWTPLTSLSNMKEDKLAALSHTEMNNLIILLLVYFLISMFIVMFISSFFKTPLKT